MVIKSLNLSLTVGIMSYALAYAPSLFAQITDISKLKTSELKLSLVADATHQLNGPADLGVNPVNPNQFFIVNHAENSAVIVEFDEALAEDPQIIAVRKASGPGSAHYLPKPSGIAFADNGIFATIHDEARATQTTTPNDFMGPTLWNQEWFEGGHASHIDMLHNTPAGLGIAWIHGNAYMVNDGYHGSLTMYDFRRDHGYGGSYHGDGVVLRYVNGQVARVPGVPSHLEFDRSEKIVYAVDSGNNRIVKLNPGLDYAVVDGIDAVVINEPSFTIDRQIRPNYDGGIQRYVDGPQLETLVQGVDVGMRVPSGLAIFRDIIYVSDFNTAKIFAFDKAGSLLNVIDIQAMLGPNRVGALAGLEFDERGRLYLLDMDVNRLYRLSAR